MKTKAVVFDLDGTLCHLWDTANPYNHTWKEIVNDVMLEELEREWYLLPVDIIILTGRKERKYTSMCLHRVQAKRIKI